MGRRRGIERGILRGFPARRTGGVHARGDPEAGRLVGLVAGDRRALELAARRLLEDHPQALERLRRLAAHPARGSQLPHAIDQRGRLAQRGQLDPGHAGRLDREVVDGERAVAPAAAHGQLLDDAARAIDLSDLKLRVLLGQRRSQLEARGGPDAHRVDAREPVVAHEVVRVGGPGGEVADEVEDLLAGGGYDCRDGDLAHGAGDSTSEELGGLPHHGERALARVHSHGADGQAAVLRERAEAELAQHLARAELVQALPRQRRAAAAVAIVGGRQGADAATHEHACEVWHEDSLSRPNRPVLHLGAQGPPGNLANTASWREWTNLARYHPHYPAWRRESGMEAFSAGTLAGAGS